MNQDIHEEAPLPWFGTLLIVTIATGILTPILGWVLRSGSRKPQIKFSREDGR